MKGKKRGADFSVCLKILLAAFFVVSVLLPLIAMLVNMGSTDVMKIVGGAKFQKACLNSVKVGAVTTLISVPLAYFLAWSVTRTAMPCKGLFMILFALPMMIPSISQGTGLILLFGANGLLTRLLHLQGNIYGFHGIVIGETMYVAPVLFLMFSDVLTYEDYVPYEAAQVLGIPRLRRFTSITLPFLWKPLISAVFTAFSLTVTDYGVPLTIGGKLKTLPVLMYEDVIGLLDFGKGSVIGAVLLIPAVIAFLVDLLTREQSKSAFVSKAFEQKKDRGSLALATAGCTVFGVFVFLPIAMFCALMVMKNYPIDLSLTTDNITKTFTMSGGEYLRNSLVIALATGLLGALIGFLTAYCSARMSSVTSRLLHLLSITTMAIPGLVLGLSYVLFYKSTFMYGTLAILILVNMMHFFASPYLMFYNVLGKLNENLEAVGLTLGVSRARIVRDVIWPQCIGTFLEVFAYFFVNAMITISAVSFLANSVTRPIALLIPQYEAQSFLECSAFVSILILVSNLLVKGGVYLLRRFLSRREIV
ncbi:MAG: ABC transporter permease subunit [Lachnospiraceae bacterium]|nr:ABC transporter permease subunit [Lachnospiraceae bacterium]